MSKKRGRKMGSKHLASSHGIAPGKAPLAGPTHIMSLRISDSQHVQLKAMAGLTGINVNRLINQAIEKSISTMIGKT